MPNPMTKQFGLKHRFAYDFSLIPESAADLYATTIPLFFADSAKNEAAAQAVQVNRANDAYEGVVTTPACYMNSRVNNVKITEYINVPAAYDSPDSLFFKAVFSFNFSDVDIKDPAGSTLIGKIFFEKAADTLHPAWDAGAVKITNGSFVHTDVDGLTSTQELEEVPVRPYTLRQEREGTLGPAVRKVMIGPILNRVHKDFPYFRERWYPVPGNVKRMNSFAGCFLYYGVNDVKTAVATAEEPWMGSAFDSELTIEEPSVHIHGAVEFNEYHDSFDQSA